MGQKHERLSKRYYTRSNQAHKKCSISSIREMKTTRKYHYTLTRTVTVKIMVIAFSGKDAEIMDLSYITGGDIKCYSNYGK